MLRISENKIAVDPGMLSELTAATFWLDLAEITGINILLSGDNAVVIALACRSLPTQQRNRAVLGGSAGAILLRVLFCLIVVWMLRIPLLKLIGGLLLLWIGVKLIVPEADHNGGGLAAKANLWSAVQTIIIADAVMSLDNVVAIAAVARDSMLLIVLGLLISVPLIVFGSQLVLKFLLRFPLLVTLGGGLLGWIAGEIISGDEVLLSWLAIDPHMLETVAKPLFGVLVMATGTILARRAAARPREVVDLASEERK
jgi:YjbE family integral membrane protein